MKEESLVVRKHITDHMQSKELMPYSIEINKNLYSSFKGALARHKEKFERKKCQTVISQKEKENETLAKNDRLKLKKQCDAIKRATDTVEKNIGESIELAESKQNFSFMIKAMR